MKRASFVVVMLLLVGCRSPRPNASLTAEQAKTVAMQLANDQAFTLYHCRPFRDGQPARFVTGRWLWVERQGFGHGDIQATVEFAADGSGHKVEVQVLDSQNLF